MNALCSLKSPHGQVHSATGEVLLAQDARYQNVSVTGRGLQAAGTDFLDYNPGLEGMGRMLGRIPPLSRNIREISLMRERFLGARFGGSSRPGGWLPHCQVYDEAKLHDRCEGRR